MTKGAVADLIYREPISSLSVIKWIDTYHFLGTGSRDYLVPWEECSEPVAQKAFRQSRTDLIFLTAPEARFFQEAEDKY